MHSDLTQEKREEVMRSFKAGNVDLLVATDVVARGIDIDSIRMVINYDIPHDPEDYVHRIGRTARGGNDEGLAITFVSEKEQPGFGRIEEFLEKTIYKIPVDADFGPTPAYEPHRHPERGRGGPSRHGGGKGKGGGRSREHAPKDTHQQSGQEQQKHQSRNKRPGRGKPRLQGSAGKKEPQQ